MGLIDIKIKFHKASNERDEGGIANTYEGRVIDKILIPGNHAPNTGYLVVDDKNFVHRIEAWQVVSIINEEPLKPLS